MKSKPIVVLAGGVGGSKLLVGLTQLISPTLITIVGNTGDDLELAGLRICPDLDTITYTLTGHVDKFRGWGVKKDTFACLEWLEGYGIPSWFRLGDRDLATHLWRTALLKQGIGLAEVTSRIGQILGLRSILLPMSESYTPTRILTDQGELHVQEYLVREKCQPRILKIIYSNIERSSLPDGLEEVVARAKMVVLAPSNPFISIGPILGVPGMRNLLQRSGLPVVAVSPVVQGKALKGPAAKMLAELGYPPSALGVARILEGIANCFVLDVRDKELQEEIRDLKMKVKVTNTVMTSCADKIALAKEVMELW